MRKRIKTFYCKKTQALFEGREVPQWRNISKVARRKLEMLNVARELWHLSVPAGNRLKKLVGNRKSQYAIRINDQYRICFYWKDGYAYEVEIVDYH